jgi:hypothetical protein
MQNISYSDGCTITHLTILFYCCTFKLFTFLAYIPTALCVSVYIVIRQPCTWHKIILFILQQTKPPSASLKMLIKELIRSIMSNKNRWELHFECNSAQKPSKLFFSNLNLSYYLSFQVLRLKSREYLQALKNLVKSKNLI